MLILAVSGSLKSTSTNTLVLHRAAAVRPPDVQFVFYDGLGDLPHFSPELDTNPAPIAVQHWREQVRSADAVLICTPEYAYGMPGSLKNALDWAVSSGEFVGKLVGAMSAAPNAGGGGRAHQSLVLTLTALSAQIVEGAALIIPLVRGKLGAQECAIDPLFAQQLKAVVEALASAADNAKIGLPTEAGEAG